MNAKTTMTITKTPRLSPAAFSGPDHLPCERKQVWIMEGKSERYREGESMASSFYVWDPGEGT